MNESQDIRRLNQTSQRRSVSATNGIARSVTICVNCNQPGHKYKHCTEPITSFGIVAYKYTRQEDDLNADLKQVLKCTGADVDDKETLKFLMVQRKDTMGYIDFIRGKYPSHEPERTRLLKTYLCEMTVDERKAIETLPFHQLWSNLWINHESRYYIEERAPAERKYRYLDIPQLLSDTLPDYPHYLFQEFGFPKGRKNMHEDTRTCAIREFTEETGYTSQDYTFERMEPLVELFMGTNGVWYKHVYYVVRMHSFIKGPTLDTNNPLQIGEIKNLGWFTFHQALSVIRPYDTAKKNILKQVRSLIFKN